MNSPFRVPVFPQRRGVPEVRQDGVIGANPDVVSPALGGDVHHAVRGRAEVVLRHRAPGFRELYPHHSGVEEHRVHRVHHVLVQLQPVARMPEREGNQAVVGLLVGIEVRERRDVPGRSHVGEDEAGELARRVRPLRDGVSDGALGRLAGGLEDHPVDVEQPAVVAAAEPPLRDDAELQRRAAVTAVPVQDPDPAFQVAKHHEVLAQDPHRQGNVAELRGERHRLPVAAEQLAARRPGTDMGQLLVLGRNAGQGVAAIRAGVPIRGDVHGYMMPPTAHHAPVRRNAGPQDRRRRPVRRPIDAGPKIPPIPGCGRGSDCFRRAVARHPWRAPFGRTACDRIRSRRIRERGQGTRRTGKYACAP